MFNPPDPDDAVHVQSSHGIIVLCSKVRHYSHNVPPNLGAYVVVNFYFQLNFTFPLFLYIHNLLYITV